MEVDKSYPQQNQFTRPTPDARKIPNAVIARETTNDDNPLQKDRDVAAFDFFLMEKKYTVFLNTQARQKYFF